MKKHKLIALVTLLIATLIILIDSYLEHNFYNVEIDESLLENICETNWKDSEFLTDQGALFIGDSPDEYAYLAASGDEKSGYVMRITSIGQERPKGLKKYKSLEYEGFVVSADSSWFFSNNCDVVRQLDIYIEELDVHISITDSNKKKNGYAFSNFFTTVCS